jgi:protein-tyrosine phosphatase
MILYRREGMAAESQIRLVFVCLGNICRSPTAEGVMKALAEQAGVAERLFIDSAGTGAWHVGERADARSRAEALRRGVELTSLARRFVREDFDRFDYVLAMDRQNHRDLRRLAHAEEHERKLHLLRSFDPRAGSELDVPDPYYGEGNGFARVYDICEAGCRGLLSHLRATHQL